MITCVDRIEPLLRAFLRVWLRLCLAMATLAPGDRLKGWTIGGLLGRGAFGGVYAASAPDDPAAYALKVALLKGVGASKLTKGMTQSREAALLYKEYNLYAVHFRHPECRHLARLAPRQPYGDEGNHRWLAMQRMGRPLRACLAEGGGTAPWPTVANRAGQMGGGGGGPGGRGRRAAGAAVGGGSGSDSSSDGFSCSVTSCGSDSCSDGCSDSGRGRQ